MASWNGSSLDGDNTTSHSGQGLGLPSAFPKNSSGQSRNVGNFTNHRKPRVSSSQSTTISSSQSYENTPNFSTENFGNHKRSFTLTDTDIALAANSSLTPTAGEFIPRSQSAQLNKKKQSHNLYTPNQYENRSKTGYQNGPQNKRHGYSQSNRGRGSFDSGQRNSAIEDSKFQDRQRFLSEAGAVFNSVSNPEPASVNEANPNSSISRESQIKDSFNGSRSNHVDHYAFNRMQQRPQNQEPYMPAYYGSDGSPSVYNSRESYRNEESRNEPEPFRSTDSYGRNQGKYDNTYRRRNQETYDKGGAGTNWRGNSKGSAYVSETFLTSKNSQSRQAYAPASNQSSPRRDPRDAIILNKDDDASQRERLIDQLGRGTLECLVCCDRIKQQEAVWSCTQCFHVLHLRCIKKWAFTSKADNGWRCPACQFVTAKVPSEYFCFCGQTRDPEWNRQDVAHSCGEVCNKSRTSRLESVVCTHRCTLLCHPGPCPVCTAQVKRFCGCGATSRVVKCGSDTALLCDGVCGKDLNCGQHKCQLTCHVGLCGDCDAMVDQVCYCGKDRRVVPCTADTFSVVSYACPETCGKPLDCGNHTCTLPCHPGDCIECQLSPAVIKTCPCGKQVLSVQRQSCNDEIPTCGERCNKKLKCGQPSCPHECRSDCHAGDCPPCPLTTLVRCRCGNMDKELPCTELTTKADDARCNKKCTKKRGCGKHKCNQLCCIDLDHVCPLTCNHQLSCGRHRCEQLCHKGHCKPCHRVSWEELFCECGKTVTLPPIPCGTRPPECTEPCSRAHPCEHPPQHNCHSYPNCPPCTVFTTKHCYGNHLLRKNIPCYLTDISCGLPCDKQLPCSRHKCILACHLGPCLKPGQRCVQGCTNQRSLCGHMCGAPCHEGACPDTPCKEMVKVTCECGNRVVSRACAENVKEYQRIATSLLASKMADMQLGHAVDITDLAGSATTRKVSLKTLECNEDCRLLERNRRLAIGLQIVNPDLSAKLTPRYSEFMRSWAKKDPHFCQMIHTKLSELVQLAKQSKQKSRSYSFEPMNRDKRHFVHECCEHFGCQSEAYDPEPKRNVVATAIKDKAWLPSMGLMEVIQRENGVRKIPKPVINYTNSSTTLTTTSTPSSSWRSVPATSSTTTPQPKPAEPIDYFDFTS